MSRWVLVPAALACAVAAALFAAFLARDRELVASTPSPRPLFDLSQFEVPAGQPLCISDVTIPPQARAVRFQAGASGGRRPALDVTLEAPGYRDRRSLPGGYPDGAVLTSAMRPPARAVLGRVCIAARGDERFALAGSTEQRTQSRPVSSSGGRPVTGDPYLAFYAARSASALSQAGSIAAHMSAFRPGIVGPCLLWPLLFLTVVGVPAGAVAAALRAARTDAS